MLTAFLALFIFALFLPTFFVAQNVIQDSLTDGEMRALLWVKQNTPRDSVVLADVSEGNYITALANRKNVADSFFLFAPARYDEVTETFTTQSQVKALQIIKKYRVNFFYVSNRARQKHHVDRIVYLDDQCFKEVYYDPAVVVYKITC